jgi:hypothetical protein
VRDPASRVGTPADDVRGRAGYGGTDTNLPGQTGRESAGRGNAWGGGGKLGEFLSSIASGRAGRLLGIYLGNDPAAYAELSLALGRLEMKAADWAAIQAPVLVASGAHDFLWPPAIGC